MNPKPLLLLNHFTFPVFLLPTAATTAAATPSSAIAANRHQTPKSPRKFFNKTKLRKKTTRTHTTTQTKPNSSLPIPVDLFSLKLSPHPKERKKIGGSEFGATEELGFSSHEERGKEQASKQAKRCSVSHAAALPSGWRDQ
jgi:hypothetical protein